MRRILGAVTSAVLVLGSLSGCGTTSGGESVGSIVDFSAIDESSIHFVQLEEPAAEDAVVTMTFQLPEEKSATISAVLYPEYAPNTVSNFIARVEEGYYNDKYVFSIQRDLFFLGGSSVDGSEWKTDTDEPIENEISQDLWPITGALCSVSYEDDYGDSRFMVINNYTIDAALEQECHAVGFPENVLEIMKEKGGVPTVWGQYTIFGQVVEGLEHVETVMSQSYDFTTYKPLAEIPITDIYMTTYGEL